jgi:putative tricarboxylic transport membrane protein
MNRAETLVGAAILAIGIWVLVEAIKFPYFLEGVPGPGFLPLWVSFGIIGTGLVLTAQGIRRRLVPREGITWPNATGWRQVGLMLGALAVSLLLLEKLGFMVTTTLFMAVVIFCLGMRSWRMLVSVPLLSAIGLYGIFAVWLRVPLPKGILAVFG